MGGGLMQLVAYGAQDVYLTGNPQITFFKVVYRRHTNFSMECIQQTVNGSQALVAANTVNGEVTISRNGDLVHKMYVRSDTPGITDGSRLVNQVDLEIGGQLIDRHHEEWMHVWNELSTPDSKAIGLKSMQCAVGTSNGDGVASVNVPLLFWFCRNPGLALPLIALQYHEVKLKFTFGTGNNVAPGANPQPAVQVWADYIYLDTDERRRFAQVSHEYLIEQVQRQAMQGNNTQKLNFNHPVKELVWTTAAANGAPNLTTRLTLNGHDRFADQRPEYFQLRQPFDHHTAVPRQNLPTAGQLTSNMLQASANNTNMPVQLTTPQAVTPGANPVTAVANAANYYLLQSPVDAPVVVAATSFAAGTILNNAACVTAAANQRLALVMQTAQAAVFANFVGRVIRINGAGLVGGVAQMLATVLAVGPVGGGAGAGQLANTGRAVFLDRHIHSALTGPSNLAASYPGGFQITSVTLFIPSVGLVNQARTSQKLEKVNVYSFALKPEEHQPSGTCNFSRIDTAHLVFAGQMAANAVAAPSHIYAVNYNVLRIMSGMGGLAYSN
jgi:hypothetical protein